MSKNDITGDRLVSRGLSEEGKKNFDLIFNKKCGDCLGVGVIIGRDSRGVDTGLRHVCVNCHGTGVEPIL